jgi:L-asparaginase
MQANITTSSHLVVLGTGGTIAGEAGRPDDNIGYRAAQRGVADLLAGLPLSPGVTVSCEQVAQLDSKDMDHQTWQVLLERVLHCLADPAVQGVVITHGTDTLEETAYFLSATLGPCAKPVVLTCSMRPATALAPDGPQNLVDAVAVAAHPHAAGVLVVCAGLVHGARSVQKIHTYQPDAFSSGDDGPCARLYEGQVAWLRSPVSDGALLEASACLALPADTWPWVSVLYSHAGAQGREVDALVAQGVRGLVIAATGNGTLNQGLDQALRRAAANGVAVCRSSRCAFGPVLVTDAGGWPVLSGLNPVKARVALMLKLMA